MNNKTIKKKFWAYLGYIASSVFPGPHRETVFQQTIIRPGRVAEVIKCLPCNGECLFSNHSTAEKKRRKKNKSLKTVLTQI
jgi:hypothetical protein